MRTDPKRQLLVVLAGAFVVVFLVYGAGSQVVPWALALLVLGFLGLIVYVWVVVLRAFFLSHFAPVRTARGVVTRKYTKEYDIDLSPRRPGFSGPDDLMYESWNFWAAFDVGDTELEFRLRQRVYITLEEGASYRITYRGEKLLDAVSLEPPKQIAPPSDALIPTPPPPPPPPPPDNSDLRPLG